MVVSGKFGGREASGEAFLSFLAAMPFTLVFALIYEASYVLQEREKLKA